jgi:hypothetical protein
MSGLQKLKQSPWRILFLLRGCVFACRCSGSETIGLGAGGKSAPPAVGDPAPFTAENGFLHNWRRAAPGSDVVSRDDQ